MTESETDDAAELLALERLIRRADGFALAFARVNAAPRRRELVGELLERLGADVRIVPVDVPPETTDLESLLARVYDAEARTGKVALFVFGIERVLSSVRERNGFLPVLNYKRENLQREVPCPVVVWLPEFALRLVAEGAPDTWAWRSGVFEFAIDRAEADRTWETLRGGGSVDEYARMMPDERLARIETIEALYDDYTASDDASEPVQVEARARLADRLSRLYRSLPDLDTALEWAERCLALLDRALGPDHPDTLTSVNNLGSILGSRGDLVGAEALYRRALNAFERVLGPEHPNTLASINNLGVLLKSRGDLDGAEVLHRRVLDVCERMLGPNHPDTLTSVNNLGGLLISRGDLVGAEALYRRVIGTSERVLGPDHPNTLASINNLSHLLHLRGDLDGSEALYRRVSGRAERVLGPDHPHTKLYRKNLVLLLEDRQSASAPLPDPREPQAPRRRPPEEGARLGEV